MTFTEIRDRLLKAGIEEADEEANILICEICKLSRHELVFRKEENFDSAELEASVSRREKREPLQYILGSWWFCGLKFGLNRDCLCPRPDTELCVETALRLIPRNARFCDIGTGSGAIAVSVLYNRPDLSAKAIDISEGALQAARDNAISNGVLSRCDFEKCDARDPENLNKIGTFDCVISNPPYIRTADLELLAPELSHEPRIALDGGEDGMKFYKAILTADKLIKDNGFYIFEIAYDEADDITELARNFGFSTGILKDCSGNDRVAVIRKEKGGA